MMSAAGDSDAGDGDLDTSVGGNNAGKCIDVLFVCVGRDHIGCRISD